MLKIRRARCVSSTTTPPQHHTSSASRHRQRWSVKMGGMGFLGLCTADLSQQQVRLYRKVASLHHLFTPLAIFALVSTSNMLVKFLVLFLTGFVGLILASDPWTVTITPNSVATGESHWSLSGTNYVVGLQTGKVVYWSATINSTHPNATVKADTGNAVVTFKKGIFINFLDNEGQ